MKPVQRIEYRAPSARHLVAFVHPDEGWCSYFGFSPEGEGAHLSAEVLRDSWGASMKHPSDAWIAHMLLMEFAN